jgi:hypothetical protein
VYTYITLVFSLTSSNVCLDECISENYQMDISTKPLKFRNRKNSSEYLLAVYFSDFEFVSVTYTGKVEFENYMKRILSHKNSSDCQKFDTLILILACGYTGDVQEEICAGLSLKIPNRVPSKNAQ